MRAIVGVYKVSDDAKVPFFATEMSACADLCACFHQETVKYHGATEPQPVYEFGTDKAFIRLLPNDMVLVPTGLIFCLPKGYCIDIRSRSGNAWKRFLTVVNQPGTIDADYTLETFVILHNQSNNDQKIKTGDAIAQCKLNELVNTDFCEVDEEQFDHFINVVGEKSARYGGFGSTDKLKE